MLAAFLGALHEPRNEIRVGPALHRHDDGTARFQTGRGGRLVPVPQTLLIGRAVGFRGVLARVIDQKYVGAEAKHISHDAGGLHTAALVGEPSAQRAFLSAADLDAQASLIRYERVAHLAPPRLREGSAIRALNDALRGIPPDHPLRNGLRDEARFTVSRGSRDDQPAVTTLDIERDAIGDQLQVARFRAAMVKPPAEVQRIVFGELRVLAVVVALRDFRPDCRGCPRFQFGSDHG